MLNLKIRKNIIIFKFLRKNIQDMLKKLKRGFRLLRVKKTKLLSKIFSIKKDIWKEIIDFTKIKKGGVSIKELLQHF